MRTHMLMIFIGSMGILMAAGASAQQRKAMPRSYRIGNVNVRVVKGDLMKTPAKALMLNINSGGMGAWNGKVDRVIMGTAGLGYHQQLDRNLNKFGDLKTFVAKGKKQQGRTDFEHVVFVGDNWRSPLKKVVCNGLECANTAGYNNISMPAMRMGLMRGVVERTIQETANAMVQGIQKFAAKHSSGTAVRNVTIVVHRNQDTIDALNSALNSAAANR